MLGPEVSMIVAWRGYAIHHTVPSLKCRAKDKVLCQPKSLDHVIIKRAFPYHARMH